MNRFLGMTAACGLLVLVGCGGAKDELTIVPIHGGVTSGGKPVPGLFVNFEPKTGRPSWALTDKDGKYEAHYTPERAGVLAGECQVWVRLQPLTPKEEMEMQSGKHPRQTELKDLLAKYARQKSPLTLQITADKTEVDLKLD